MHLIRRSLLFIQLPLILNNSCPIVFASSFSSSWEKYQWPRTTNTNIQTNGHARMNLIGFGHSKPAKINPFISSHHHHNPAKLNLFGYGHEPARMNPFYMSAALASSSYEETEEPVNANVNPTDNEVEINEKSFSSKVEVINHGTTGILDNSDCKESCPQPNEITQNSQAVFLSHETNCAKFYICDFGKPVELSCPAGQLWDNNIKTCNFASQVNCANKLT